MASVRIGDKYLLMLRSRLIELTDQKIELFNEIKKIKNDIRCHQRMKMTQKQMANIKKAREILNQQNKLKN